MALVDGRSTAAGDSATRGIYQQVAVTGYFMTALRASIITALRAECEQFSIKVKQFPDSTVYIFERARQNSVMERGPAVFD